MKGALCIQDALCFAVYGAYDVYPFSAKREDLLIHRVEHLLLEQSCCCLSGNSRGDNRKRHQNVPSSDHVTPPSPLLLTVKVAACTGTANKHTKPIIRSDRRRMVFSPFVHTKVSANSHAQPIRPKGCMAPSFLSPLSAGCVSPSHPLLIPSRSGKRAHPYYTRMSLVKGLVGSPLSAVSSKGLSNKD